MITEEIKQSLTQYFESISGHVLLVLQSGSHPKREELSGFLESLCALSPNLEMVERDTEGMLRSPISFAIEVDGEYTGIIFSGIPSGHEFNSLILAILRSSGSDLKLDEGIQKIVQQIDKRLDFEVFVSLSCHNCPDVVQTLNQFALTNINISVEMIDGGLFKNIIDERDIQGVPSVYLNGEVFANGKVDPSTLIEKLIELEPDLAVISEGTPELPTQDVIIIGGGPAGVAAAIYTARKGFSVTLVSERLGGQLKDTMGIENLISLPVTTGTELSNSLESNLSGHENVTLKNNLKVNHVDLADLNTVVLSSGEKITGRSLIIATGARWRELGVPGEKENIGNGVAFCPHCDGPMFKGKSVGVVGGGNSGIEAAIDLSGIVESVTVYEFAPQIKADRILVDQLEARKNVTVKVNVAVNKILSQNGKVNGIEYEKREDGSINQDKLSGIFVQIGLVPNSQHFVDILETKPWGEIVINEKCETSQPGVFACGDVTTTPYKQIAIAMGEGSKAALSATEYLQRNAITKAAV